MCGVNSFGAVQGKQLLCRQSPDSFKVEYLLLFQEGNVHSVSEQTARLVYRQFHQSCRYSVAFKQRKQC